MRILFPIFGILQLTLWLAWGQGMQSYKDAEEERALQKARALKEMKKAIDGPSAPAPMKLMAGGLRSSPYEASIPAPGEGGARYEQMKREPLKLSVVTATGLVPLTTYQDPNWQSNQATEAAKREAEEGAGIGRKLESQIKAWRISFFDRNATLDGAAGEAAQMVPVEQAAGAPPESPTSEVVAIVEETPSRVAGEQPERKILGFLPSNRSGKPVAYRGLQAKREPAVGRPAAPEVPPPPGEPVAAAVAKRDNPESRTVGREPKRGEESFTERDVVASGVSEPVKRTLSRWVNRKGEDDLVASGEEVSLNPASAEQQKSFLARWFDRSGGAAPVESGPAQEPQAKPSLPRIGRKEEASALEGADFLATVEAQAPFNVIHAGSQETYEVKLPLGTVGRATGSGDQWAWMQLDSGLSGLMRKRHLRPAGEAEIQEFLASERSSKGRSGSPAKRTQADGTVAERGEEAKPKAAPAESPAEVAAGETSPVPVGMNAPAEAPKEAPPSEVPLPVQQVLKSLE